MARETAIALVERQDWLDGVDQTLDSAAGAVLDRETPAARELQNCLHGTWLGHPLHPVLTDVPLGAWTAAAAMDVLDTVSGGDRYATGADAALAVGLVGALGAAVTGLADWRHTDGRARRVGVMHAVLNASATVLYTSSLLLRRGGRRGAGRAVSFLGYAIVSASAYLGGHLVYGERIGVNHATETLPEPEFTPALADADLKEGEPQRVEVNGAPVFLLRQGGRIHALANRCAHLGGPLSEGEIREGCVTCPWHRSTFSLEDGRVIQGPSAYPQPVLETRVRDGQIEVRGPQKEQ